MPATYEPIASQTLGSDTTTVTFSSIPDTYTDLELICHIRSALSATNTAAIMRINSDTGTNYSATRLGGTGSSAASARQSNQTSNNLLLIEGDTATSGVFSILRFAFLSYANTNVFKTCLGSSFAPTQQLRLSVGLWRSTAAISSVSISTDNGNVLVGSTLSLYGIKAA